jgi:hypothetical protein
MKDEILSQYRAALAMLKSCVEQYDEDLWRDGEHYRNAAWHIAYHVLFFANIYGSPREDMIEPWEGQTRDYQILGKTPWPPHEEVVLERIYSRREILEFLEHVEGFIPGYLEAMEAEADCWPFWYSLNQVEFQLNNLRHIQHHTAQLLERQNSRKPIDVEWERF